MKIILASGSPRRKNLLNLVHCDHEVIVPNIEEKQGENESVHEYIARNTKEKLEAVASQTNTQEDTLIIAADTIVWFENKVLEKPKNHNEAFAMLESLSNNTHEVHTSYGCLLYTSPSPRDKRQSRMPSSA